MHRMSRM